MCLDPPGAGVCSRQRVPERRDCSRPVRPSRRSPPLCRVPGDVRMLEKEEAEEEGKGARLPPPPVGAGPLAGAQGRRGGARDELAAAPPEPSPPAGAAPGGSGRICAAAAAWTPRRRDGGGRRAASCSCWRPRRSFASALQVRSGTLPAGRDASALRVGECGDRTGGESCFCS